MGTGGSTVSLVTVGSNEGGAISIAGVDNTGQPDFTSGNVTLSGNVQIDTTNNGDAFGAAVNIVNGDDAKRPDWAQNEESPAALQITAGIGNVALGDFNSLSRVDNLTIASASDVNLNSVYAGGNTIDISATGTITAAGAIDDSIGDVLIQTLGDISIAGPTTSGQNIVLASASGNVSTSAVSSQGSLFVGAAGDILLGSNVAAATGTVTLVTGGNFESQGGITSGADTKVVASGGVKLGTAESGGVTSAGNVTVTSSSGDVEISDTSASGDVVVVSSEGQISQIKNTTLSSQGSAFMSASQGINVATIDASQDVTLVIKATAPNPDGSIPGFARVNDPIPLGQGDSTPDIRATSGAIVFLAPVANVGSAEATQNFVQRSGGGIFYGLEEGSFFSDDIGSTLILNTIPQGAQDNVRNALSTASSVDFSSEVRVNLAAPISIDVDSFNASIASSANATASAGETSAASSSRSTAASQGDEEEEVAEVDELVFENLRNYDENLQGLKLPEDQAFAYDDDGNVYLIVTLRGSVPEMTEETFTLFKVELDAMGSQLYPSPTKQGVEPQMYGYLPEFIQMGTASGED